MKESKTEQSMKRTQHEYGDLKNTLASELQSSEDALREHRSLWPEREKMLWVRLSDKLGEDFKSKVSIGRLSTLLWESAARVAARPPQGKLASITESDKGQASVMDLVLQNYVFPNAYSQMPFNDKLLMWYVFAGTYGSSFMLRFWNVSDRYVGPDCRLIPMRAAYPQPQKGSVQDSDWFMVESRMSVGQLRKHLKNKTEGWVTEGLKKVIEQAEQGGGPTVDDDKKTDRESELENDTVSGKGDFAEVRIIQKFESGNDGHWLLFAPDYESEVLRDVENQHGDSLIPVTKLDRFPVPNSMMGQGDIERGASAQKAEETALNLYLDSVKMALYPPIIENVNDTIPSTIRYIPGARWRVKSPNAIDFPSPNPQGLQTFTGVTAYLSSVMQNQQGTTDTTVSSTQAGDPTFGKTPQGINQTKQKQNARDFLNQTRFEGAVSELVQGFANMLGHVGKEKDSKQAIFHLFDDDIKKLERQWGTEDAGKFLNKQKGVTAKKTDNRMRVSVEPSSLKGMYLYRIEPGSTRKQDQEEAYARLSQFFQVLPNMKELLMQEGYIINLGEFIKQMVMASGIEGAEKILQKEEVVQQRQQMSQVEQQLSTAERVKKLEGDYSNINYKDLPEDVKRIAEQREFGQASQMQSPAEQKQQTDEAKLKLKAESDAAKRDEELAQAEHDPSVLQADRMVGEQGQQKGMTVAEADRMLEERLGVRIDDDVAEVARSMV